MLVRGELGRMIRRGVERRGISVTMLADRAGLSVSGTYKIIAGTDSMPKEETLVRIGHVLGIEPAVLWDAAQKDHKPVNDTWSAWTARLMEVVVDNSLTAEKQDDLRRKLLGIAKIEAEVG